jgi:hypothetical protein
LIALAGKHFLAQIRKEVGEGGRANKQGRLQHRAQFGPFLLYGALFCGRRRHSVPRIRSLPCLYPLAISGCSDI